MKNSFKILLLSLFTVTLYSFDSNEYLEHDITMVENEISTICGFLEVKSSYRTNKIVTANRDGCFRWKFLNKGKVTSISEFIYIKKGESKRGFSKDGQTVEINCHCRSIAPNY